MAIAPQPPVGMAVAGEIDGDQRAVEGHGDGVPGVGVLAGAVQENQLRCFSAPYQPAQPARADGD